jgi:hypothetical protein
MTPPPALPTPQPGPTGNLPPPKVKKCPKGKRKVKRNGKVRCVKKRHQQRDRSSGRDK